MKNINWILRLKILFMLIALAGIFSAMTYFRSGKAFKEPGSAAHILLGSPADSTPRPAKSLSDPPEKDTNPAPQDPANR